MEKMEEIESLAILTATPLLGSIKIRLLIEWFGSAQTALDASVDEVMALPGFGPKIGEKWGWWWRDDSWKKNLELAEKAGVSLISFKDPLYPEALGKVADAPVLLYAKGTLLKTDRRAIAVVGTRNATVYGREQAERFSERLAGSGFTIVSGLARGIDTSAHAGALKRGRTIAVLGSGLANIYPKENVALASRIAESGAVLSEYPMLAPPDRQHFPQRNRIVSGMTLGTLLIEAPEESGAMLTMGLAINHKRRRWALPGRCDLENFDGNHKLIRDGNAELVTAPDQILLSFEEMFPFQKGAEWSQPTLPPLEKEEAEFLNFFPNEEINIEEISQMTKLPIMKINVLLMSLVMKQVLKEYPGKIYKRMDSRGFATVKG